MLLHSVSKSTRKNGISLIRLLSQALHYGTALALSGLALLTSLGV